MRQYETIYIVNPNVSQDKYREVIERYNTLIEKNKGVIIKTEEWGTQRLAYEIKKLDRGAYVLLNYCGNPGLTAELERDLSLDDRVLKFQTIKVAHQADPQELLRKQKEKEVRQQAPTPQERPPETVDAASGDSVEEPKGEETANA